MEEKILEDNNNKVIDIFPLNKWKRVLLFLADLFINFILSFVVFNVAVMPIGKLATGYTNKAERYNQNLKNMHSVLYGNKVVLHYNEYSEDDIDSNINYTYNCWLSYYCYSDESSIDANYPQYGHKDENDIIANFYSNIRNDNDSYLRFGTYDNNIEGIACVQRGILDFVREYILRFGSPIDGSYTYMYNISGRDAYAPMLLAASRNEKYLKAIAKRFELDINVE